jgi:hypothetical protein
LDSVRAFPFAEDRLARAIAATFARRQTDIAIEAPDALTSDFANDPAKQRQWAASVGDIDGAPKALQAVIADLASF